MLYSSTRGGMQPLPFKSTVMAGLARDGGLFLPERFPDVSDRLAAWSDLGYADLAFEVMRLFADDISERDLRDIVARSYAAFSHPEVAHVRQVGPVHVLELFHGPTLAFKDVALQFLGNLFEHILAETGGELNIVAATSGDTGSAAIHGVRGRQGVRIFVMHPAGRVSPVQELQMTSVTDANVYNIALQGTFDDAQAIVKTLFGDLAFRDRHHLGAVNSINWARVLAQIVYYFHAGLQVMKRTGADRVSFAVPTGNFGDIFAGYLAKRMGLPVERLIIATNRNDILSRFVHTGVYAAGEVYPTLSPAMDIQIASNFERYLYYLVDQDPALVAGLLEGMGREGRLEVASHRLDRAQADFAAVAVSDEAILAQIRETFQQEGYILDPHTATGVRAAQGSTDVICLATAHPAKFAEAVTQAIGREAPPPPALQGLLEKETRCARLEASEAAVRAHILATLAKVNP